MISNLYTRIEEKELKIFKMLVEAVTINGRTLPGNIPTQVCTQ